MVKCLIRIKPTLILIVGVISILYLTGCEQKTEKPGDEQISEDTTVTEQPVDTTAAQDTSADTADKPAMIDLKGRWTGTFDQRSATLTISEQNENEFSGSLTVEYRERMNKVVSGKINMDAMTFTMTDTQHSRDRGKYSGKITEEGKLSGTFTMDLDGKNYSFNLTKR